MLNLLGLLALSAGIYLSLLLGLLGLFWGMDKIDEFIQKRRDKKPFHKTLHSKGPYRTPEKVPDKDFEEMLKRIPPSPKKGDVISLDEIKKIISEMQHNYRYCPNCGHGLGCKHQND